MGGRPGDGVEPPGVFRGQWTGSVGQPASRVSRSHSRASLCRWAESVYSLGGKSGDNSTSVTFRALRTRRWASLKSERLIK
jgi:hypothetical protein